MSGEIDDLYVLLRAQTAPLEEGFLTAGSAGEELAGKIAATVAEITASVDRMAENARIAGGSIDEMTLKAAADYDRLAKATMEASAKMEAATARAAAANEKLGASMAADSGPVLGGMKMAKSFAVAAAGAAIIGGATVKMAADFETSTTRLVTTAGETQANLGMVRQGILDMTSQVGYSAEELSASLYKIEPAGYHGADGLKVLKAAAEGAKEENANLTTVGDALSTMLLDFHKKGSDAADVMSKMVAATASGKMTFEELAGALSSVAPIASAANISMDDMLGVLASMTSHGISAQQATQNMADAIRHLQAPIPGMRSEMNLLGLNADDIASKLGQRGLAGTMELLQQAVSKSMPPGSEKVYLDMANAVKQANPKVQDLATKVMDGSISLKDFTKSAKDLDVVSAKQAMSFATLAGQTHQLGTQTKTGEQVLQTYGGALKAAMGDATGLKVALMTTGENAKNTDGAIKSISGATAEAGGHVKGWSDIQSNFNLKMSQAKDGMGALAISVGEKLLPAATKLMGYLADGAKWLSKHQAIATVLAVALGVLAVGFTIAAIAIWAMNSALLANPITWIILAIVAAVAILGIAIYELVTHWKTVWKAITDVAEGVWHWLVSVWKAIAKDTSKFWHDDIVKPIMSAWHAIENFFKSAYHAVADPIAKAWHAIESVTHTVWSAISSWLKKWWPLLLVIFAFPIATLIAIWNHFHKQIMDVVHTVWNAVSGFFKTVWKDIQEGAKVAWNLFHQYVIDPVEAVWHRIVEVWDIVVKALDGVWKNVQHAADVAWKAVYDNIIRPIEDAWHRVESVGDSIWHAISGAFDSAWHAVEHIGDRFLSIGSSIVEGIVRGIKNAGGHLFKSLGDLANDALNAAKKFLGVNSPSKLFADHVGVAIPEGIAAGVMSAAHMAHGAVRNMVSGLAVAPRVSVAGDLSFAMPGGGGLPGVSIPAMSAPIPGGSGGGGPSSPVVVAAPAVQVYIGDEEIRKVNIRVGQRNKLRNGTTGLT